MSILNEILGAQGGKTVATLAQQFGLSQDQTTAALGQLVPSLNKAMQRNAQTDDGLSSLLRALQGGGHQRYLEQPEAVTRPEAIQDGNAILGHLFGSKDVSREVAKRASASTGIGTDILKKMLPMVAGLAMGSASRGAGKIGLGNSGAPQAKAGGLLSSLLDQDGDGSVTDDLWNLAKKMF